MCKQNKPCNLQVKGRDLPWLGQVWYCMFSVHTPSVSRENILYIGGVTIRRYRTEQPAFTYMGAYLTTNFIGRGEHMSTQKCRYRPIMSQLTMRRWLPTTCSGECMTTIMDAWLGLTPKRPLENPDKSSKKSRKEYDQTRYIQKKAGPVKWDNKLQRGRPWLVIKGEEAVCSCKPTVMPITTPLPETVIFSWTPGNDFNATDILFNYHVNRWVLVATVFYTSLADMINGCLYQYLA